MQCFGHLEDELHRHFSESLIFVHNDDDLVGEVGFGQHIAVDLLQQIDTYSAHNDKVANTPIVILGENGSGKSALLANWTLRRLNLSHHNEHIFFHAIGCSRLSCQVSQLLRRLANWLCVKFNLKEAVDLSSDEKLPWILPRLLERASKKGSAIIVLDGLQHIKGRGLKWLPSKLPPNVHMLVSSSVLSRGDVDADAMPTSEYSRQQQTKTQHICDDIKRRNWPTLVMNPLCEESIRSIVAKCLPTEMKKRDGIADDLCSHPNANNPAFLTLTLTGILHSPNSVKQHVACKNTTELIEQMLAQFDFGVQSYGGNSLSLLFVARHGLHEDELYDLLGNMTNKNETSSLCEEDQKLLVKKLCGIGVVRLDTDFGRLFTIPANNPALRDVVFNKYITTTARETAVRSLIVEYFESKNPSLRYCEELPWQQEKNQCPNLGRTLVDLRVLDIMYNAEELKNELLRYLSRLVLSNKLDIVTEFNRSAEKWTKKIKPTSTQMSMMCMFLAEVMKWISINVSQHADMPLFMRDDVKVDHLLYGIVDDPAQVLLSSASATTTHQTQSKQLYFYYRWLWCNWPWIALRVASKSLKDTTDPHSTVSAKKGVEVVDATTLESTVRERALTRTVPLPASLLTKLEKMISSDDSQTQRKSSTTVIIPFSTSRYKSKTQEQEQEEEAPRTNLIDSLEKKERDAKQLLDAIKIERAKRELRLQMLQADEQLASVSLVNSRHHQEHGNSIITELKSRYAKVRDLFDKAVSIESSFADILAALEVHDPANLRRHEELEHQISLSKQQLRDLRNERSVIVEHINQTRSAALSIKSLIETAMEERGEIEPLLTSLRYQAHEVEERRKSALAKKFDSAAFSKRMQLEGKIAKRRQDKLKRVHAISSQPTVEVVKDHPMIRLIGASSTTDAREIVAKLERGQEEAENLRKRQDSLDSHLKDKRPRLARLYNQIQQLGLATDSFSSSSSSSSSHSFPSPIQMDIELQRRQNQLAVISNHTTTVKVALLHLHQRVMDNDELTDIIPGLIVGANSNLHDDAKRVTSLVMDLCKDVLGPSTSSHTSDTPARYKNIRVLNKSEVESRSTEHSRSEVLCEKGTSSARASTVNLLSRSKQGRNASKGLILDAALRLK